MGTSGKIRKFWDGASRNMINYAFIDEDGIIKNISIFEDMVDNIKNFIDSQNIVFEGKIIDAIPCSIDEKFCIIGSRWNGTSFELIQPYPSWKWDSLLEQWVAPVIHPHEILGYDGINYLWDEDNLRWIEG